MFTEDPTNDGSNCPLPQKNGVVWKNAKKGHKCGKDVLENDPEDLTTGTEMMEHTVLEDFIFEENTGGTPTEFTGRCKQFLLAEETVTEGTNKTFCVNVTAVEVQGEEKTYNFDFSSQNDRNQTGKISFTSKGPTSLGRFEGHFITFTRFGHSSMTGLMTAALPERCNMTEIDKDWIPAISVPKGEGEKIQFLVGAAPRFIVYMNESDNNGFVYEIKEVNATYELGEMKAKCKDGKIEVVGGNNENYGGDGDQVAAQNRLQTDSDTSAAGRSPWYIPFSKKLLLGTSVVLV
jgi:hypothetical protein